MNTDEIVKTLQAQFDKMRGAYEVMSALAEVRKEEIESLQSQLADEKRRADAAVGDIKDAATTTEKVCKWCLHRGNRERCQSCGWATGWLIRDWKSDNWQWRGPQEAGEGERDAETV